MKTLYVNYQANSCRQFREYEGSRVVLRLPEDFVQLPDTSNVYSILRTIRPQAIYIHSVQYLTDFDKIIAFALTTGTDVTVNCEVFDNPIQLEHQKNVHPMYYAQACKEGVYQYINEMLAPIKQEDTIHRDMLDKKRDDLTRNVAFKVTPEIRKFIETYAQAYGFSIPIFEEQLPDSDTYSVKHYLDIYQDIVGLNPFKTGAADPKKAILKWELKEKARLEATKLSDIERIYVSLKWCVDNNMPYDDNYVPCKCCGKPVRTNRYGIVGLIDTPFCVDCDPRWNKGEQAYRQGPDLEIENPYLKANKGFDF